MGFLTKFKELFNKNIECDEELDNHILVYLKKKKYIYLDKNIIVRDNSACVVVYRGRVCDVLIPGKYKISKDTFPETFERAKIERLKAKGVHLKKIKVKLYYINTSEIKEFEFKSTSPFSIKSKELGKVKGCLCGVCTFRVIDPFSLMRYLTGRRRKINDTIAREEVSDLIGNKLNKLFEKSKVPFEMMFTDRQKLNGILNTECEDVFDKRGVFVKNICLKSVDIAKKHQGKVNDYIASRNVTKSPTITTNIMGIGDEFKIPIIAGLGNEGIVCKSCGYKNNEITSNCIKCGKKLN